MLHTIQADFYRFFRSKVFWIIQGCLFLYLLFGVLYGAVFYTSATEETAAQACLQGLTGVEAVQAFSIDSAMLVAIFSLILVIHLIGNDLSQKLYKNILAYGLSRTEYFIAKLAVITTLAFLQILAAYICLLAISSTVNGLGTLSADFLLYFLLLIGQDFAFILAWSCLAVGFLYISQSALLAYTAVFATMFSLVGLATLFQISHPLTDFLLYPISASSLLAGYLAFQKKDL